MSQRVEPLDSLDHFDTPPWATRALMEYGLPRLFGGKPNYAAFSVWEPAAGRGCMSEVLKEFFIGSDKVHASDVHDYGYGYAIGSFVGEGPDIARCPFKPDFIITNPPFRLAQAFAERALSEAQHGVALLMRTAFLEGIERYSFFCDDPYWIVCPFVERVPMVKGQWDPNASTATSYSWFIWGRPASPGRRVEIKHIPPGCSKTLSHVDDVARFAMGVRA